MSIFMVETYVVKSEKREEFTPALNEFLKYKEENPELFKGLKSWRLLRQEFGGISGLYVEMWEFESMADLEKITERIFSDEGMKKISKRIPFTHRTNRIFCEHLGLSCVT